jgi:hypothetical protein
VAEGKGFFTRVRGEQYAGVVRQVTVAYLLDHPSPASVSEEQWESAVKRFASGITAMVSASSMLIHWEGIPLVDGKGSTRTGAVDLITFNDVEAWIRAGVDGEPLGKRIKAGEDLGEAAHLVYTAIHGKARKDGSRAPASTKGNHGRLREAVREFLKRSPYGFGKYFPALRVLWRNAIRPLYRAEMKAWVRKTMRG